MLTGGLHFMEDNKNIEMNEKNFEKVKNESKKSLNTAVVIAVVGCIAVAAFLAAFFFVPWGEIMSGTDSINIKSLDGKYTPVVNYIQKTSLPGIDEEKLAAFKNANDEVSINASYKLNSNNEDKIKIEYKLDYHGFVQGTEAVLSVNGENKTFYLTKVQGADVVKVGGRAYVIVYEDTPNSGQNLIFFLYDGETIHFAGRLNGIEYNKILTDNKGKFIDTRGYVDFINPCTAVEHYELENNIFVRKEIDHSDLLNKKQDLSRDITVSFKASEEETDLTSAIQYDEKVNLKAGEKIELLKIEPTTGRYMVILPDERKGIFIIES